VTAELVILVTLALQVCQIPVAVVAVVLVDQAEPAPLELLF
jgi:hypothetical protein